MIKSQVPITTLTQSPCRRCGGPEYSHFQDVGFDQATGSSPHQFDLLVCRSCGQTDFFTDVASMEKNYKHKVVRVSAVSPYRS